MLSHVSGFLKCTGQNTLLSGQIPDSAKAAKVKEMLDQDCFAPFPTLRERYLFSEQSWIERISQIASGKTKGGLLTAYLFALSIDQQLTDEQKRQIIHESYLPLDKEGLKNQCYSYVDGIPTIMGIHILRYSSDEIMENGIQTLLESRGIDFCEKRLYHWIRETIHTSWPQEEKCLLIDRIFRALSSEDVNELLCYMHMTAAQEDLAAFLTICPGIIKDNYTRLMDHIAQTGQAILDQEVSIQQHHARIFRGYQNECFLKWFSEQVDHPLSFQIALHLDDKDWKKLKKFVPSLEKRAIEWVIQVTSRAALIKKWRQTNWGHDSFIASFYSFAGEYAAQAPDSDFKRWAAQFSGIHLCQYFDSILSYGNKLLTGQRLVKALLDDHLSTVKDWIKEIMTSKNPVENKVKEQLKTLIALVDKNEMWSMFIQFIVQQNDQAVALTLLCAGSNSWKKTLLRQYVSLGPQGVEMLTQEILHLLNHLNEYEDFVLIELPKFFDSLLQETSLEAYTALRSGLHDQLKDINLDKATQEFLRILFPNPIEATDDAARYQRALELLKHTLSLTHSSHQERQRSVYSHLDDLQGSDTTAAWLINLCGQIPEHLWPLLFLHYGEMIPRKKIYKDIEDGQVLVDNVDAMTEEQQAQVVESCARALSHTIDNPVLKEEGVDTEVSWCVTRIVQVIQEYDLEKRVISKMLEVVPTERFILVMNLFARHCISAQDHDFHSILRECMEEKCPSIVNFIARCLAAYHYSKKKEQYGGFCNLESEFWGKKILKSHEMRGALAKKLFEIMDLQFVGYALSNPLIFKKIVRSLEMTDETFHLQLFEKIVKLLISASNPSEFKLVSFDMLMRCYDAEGIDVLEILKTPAFVENHTAIREWYHIPNAEQLCPVHELSLRLAHLYTTSGGEASSEPPLLDGIIKKIFHYHMDNISRKRVGFPVNLFSMLDVLQKLNCKEEAICEIEESAEWMELIRADFEEQPLLWFGGQTPRHHVKLLLKWMPLWKERLKDHLMKLINESLQWSSSFKNDASHFYQAKILYHGLDKKKLLPEFIAYVEQGTTGKVKKALDDLKEAAQTKASL